MQKQFYLAIQVAVLNVIMGRSNPVYDDSGEMEIHQ